MDEQDLDLDNLDNLLEDFDGVTVETPATSVLSTKTTNLSVPVWSVRQPAAT